MDSQSKKRKHADLLQKETKPPRCKRKRLSFDDGDSLSWTCTERENLLIAMKTYGHNNIERLCEAVPTKSKERIKMYIREVCKSARHSLLKSAAKKFENASGGKRKGQSSENHLGPLDKWLLRMRRFQPHNFNEQRTLPISRALLYISKFEHHPDPSECGGIDFRAMYDFLYRMLCGYPGKALTSRTAAFMLHTMSNFAANFRRKGYEQEISFLQNLNTISYAGQHIPPSQNPSAVEISMIELMGVQGFNPFTVPMEMLNHHKENSA